MEQILKGQSDTVPSTKKPREWWRNQCLNLYFLCAAVLREAFEDKFHNFGKLHELLCDFLDVAKNPSRRKFITVYRGAYKTTVLIGYVIFLYVWSIVNKKPTSICYNTATKENAEAFMLEFQEAMRECTLLYWIFPEIPKKEGEFRKWTKWKVEYKWFKFHVASLDVKQVSRHYTVIINDDLVNNDNAFSETGREKIKRQWKFQKSIITKYKKFKVGLEIDVGTPYHSQDLISHIYKNIDSYDKFVMPYALPLDTGDPVELSRRNGYLTFPEMQVWEDFDEIFEDQGRSIFATQYELKIVEEASKLCHDHWLRYWTFLPENYVRYLVVDPAGTEDGKNDPTGFVICDVDPLGNIYVVYAEHFWLTPYNVIMMMENLRKEFDPDEIYVEKEKYSITIADTVEHLAPKLNFAFVEHMNEPKPSRIHRLKQWFETKRIFLGEGMNTLEQELLDYPDTPHVDLLDALAYVLKIMQPPDKRVKREFVPEEEPEFDQQLKRALAILEPNRKENMDGYF
jgi:hypothetical protein